MKGVKDTSGKASQRKGADGERELAAILREYGYEIKRGGSMSFGEVPDLVGLPAIFHRRSREGWRVTMNLADFMRLYCRQKTQSDRQKTAENGGKEGEDK